MVGYRTEIYWGEGYRNVAEVMAHEIFELQNTDISETLIETYCKGTRVEEILGKIIGVIECTLSEDDCDYDMLDSFFDNPDDERILELMNDIISVINEVTGKNIKYCLWLCDKKEDLYKEYNFDNNLTDDDIDEYNISDVVLSDLGFGGKLYGYENKNDMFIDCN